MVQGQAINSLTIGKLAAAAGVGVETVRYYQRRKLLDQPERDTGIRRYGSDDVRKLRFIRQAQAAGFTLEEIRELLELDSGKDRIRARQMAAARLEALDAKMTELQEARKALERLARACSKSEEGPCPILTSFKV